MPLTLHPYLLDETWVFDDDRTRLKEEASSWARPR